MKKIFSLLALVAVLLGCSSMFTGCSTLRGDQAYRADEPLAVTAKLSAEVEANTFNQSFGGMLRLQRDRQVQLSLSKYGIEGARIIFTPDSVIVLDRINKRYLKDSYATLNSMFSEMPPLNFNKVQRFFWNDDRKSTEAADFNVMGFVPVELFVSRNKTTNVRGFRIARHTVLSVHAFEKEFKLNLNLNKVRINYDWNSQVRIPSGYSPMKPDALLKLLK